MLLKDLHLLRTERLLPQILLDEVLSDDTIDIISEDYLVELLWDLSLVFLQVPNKPCVIFASEIRATPRWCQMVHDFT
jgi:hypothetical protein